MTATTTPLAKKFDAIFEKNLAKEISHHKAYEEAEEEFQKEHNCRKYASFESFRISRSKRIKGKRK